LSYVIQVKLNSKAGASSVPSNPNAKVSLDLEELTNKVTDSQEFVNGFSKKARETYLQLKYFMRWRLNLLNRRFYVEAEELLAVVSEGVREMNEKIERALAERRESRASFQIVRGKNNLLNVPGIRSKGMTSGEMLDYVKQKMMNEKKRLEYHMRRKETARLAGQSMRVGCDKDSRGSQPIITPKKGPPIYLTKTTLMRMKAIEGRGSIDMDRFGRKTSSPGFSPTRRVSNTSNLNHC
jgi:hypothetical protein